VDWELPPFPTKAELRLVKTDLTKRIDIFKNDVDPTLKEFEEKLVQLKNDLHTERLLRLRSDLFQIEDRCRELKSSHTSIPKWLLDRERQLRINIIEVERMNNSTSTIFGPNYCR